MKIYRFDEQIGQPIDKYGSNFTMTRMLWAKQQDVKIGCMYLPKQGIIGRHEASTPQLLLIVEGEGMVSGHDGENVKIMKGEAAFWEKGELHETTSDTGLMAIVIEGETLQPEQFLVTKEA